MFIPNNLRSIAAWTFGSLAGNEAYYRTKGGFRRRYSRSETITYSSPKPNPKLAALFAEVNNLTDQTKNMPVRSDGCWDITPFIQLIAYQKWFESQKSKITAEVDSPDNIQTVAIHLKSYIDGMLKIMVETSPEELKIQFFEMINRRITSCSVDKTSFKLTDSDSGRFVIRGIKN